MYQFILEGIIGSHIAQTKCLTETVFCPRWAFGYCCFIIFPSYNSQHRTPPWGFYHSFIDIQKLCLKHFLTTMSALLVRTPSDHLEGKETDNILTRLLNFPKSMLTQSRAPPMAWKCRQLCTNRQAAEATVKEDHLSSTTVLFDTSQKLSWEKNIYESFPESLFILPYPWILWHIIVSLNNLIKQRKVNTQLGGVGGRERRENHESAEANPWAEV